MSDEGMQTNRPSRVRTRIATRSAVREVKRAFKPGVRNIKQAGAWLASMAVGAFVIWKSIESIKEELPDTDNQWEKNKTRGDIRPVPPKAIRAGVSDAADNKTETVHGTAEFAKEWFARFNKTECLTRSEALAFIAVLSLIPVLLFGVAALGFIIHDPHEAATTLQNAIAQQLPGQTSETAQLVIQQAHVEEAARSLINQKWWTMLLGILLLFPSAIGLITSASEPMNAAWEVKETRSFINLRLVSLGVMVGAGLLFLISLVFSSDTLHPADAPYALNMALSLLYAILAIATNSAMFAMVYKYLPNICVSWKAAAVGGLTAGILWELAKRLFTLYVSHFGSFNKLYGALGGLAGLVTWIWYSCIVLLGCAILSKMYHEHLEGGVKKC